MMRSKNAEELREAIASAIEEVAPDADLGSLSGSVDLCDALELDALDHERFIESLSRMVGVTIPESDGAELRSVDGAMTYLEKRLARPPLAR